MKKLAYALVLTGLVGVPTLAVAAEESPHSITGNLSLVSDYAFRGISQTLEAPAIQGGFDYAHASGIYLGTWGSNVSENLYDSNMELDLYGGYSHAFNDDFSINVGGLYYHYPNAQTFDPDTFEVYAGATWKWFNAKLSYATTDLFGVADSEGSTYAELNFNYPLPMDIGFTAHYGWTEVDGAGNSGLDYEDWKIGLTKSLGGFNFGLAYTDTDLPAFAPKGDDINDGRFILSVGKTF